MLFLSGHLTVVGGELAARAERPEGLSYQIKPTIRSVSVPDGAAIKFRMPFTSWQ